MELHGIVKGTLRRSRLLVSAGLASIVTLAPVRADSWQATAFDDGSGATVVAPAAAIGLDGSTVVSVVAPVLGPESVGLLFVGVAALLFVRRLRA